MGSATVFLFGCLEDISTWKGKNMDALASVSTTSYVPLIR